MIRLLHCFYIIIAVFILTNRISSAKETNSPIVYSARYYTSQEETIRSYYHLYLINPDGTGKRQITSVKANDRAPRWSENGQLIYFFRFQPDSHIQESWVYDIKANKERRFSGTPQIDQNNRMYDLPLLESIVSKRFPKKKLERSRTTRFSDGTQASLLELAQRKQQFPWSKPEFTYSVVLLIQNQQEKVVRHMNIRGIIPRYASIEGRVPVKGDFVVTSSQDTLIIDKDSGLCVPLYKQIPQPVSKFNESSKRDVRVRAFSPDGKQFVGLSKGYRDQAIIMMSPDSGGKPYLKMWEGERNLIARFGKQRGYCGSRSPARPTHRRFSQTD